MIFLSGNLVLTFWRRLGLHISVNLLGLQNTGLGSTSKLSPLGSVDQENSLWTHTVFMYNVIYVGVHVCESVLTDDIGFIPIEVKIWCVGGDTNN